MRSLFLPLSLICILPSPSVALAAGAEQSDRAEVEARVAAFDAVMKAGRIGETLDFLPPRFFNVMKGAAEISDTEFKALIASQAAEAFKVVTLVSFGMDVPAATPGATSAQRRYMMIPTQIVMKLPNDQKMQVKTTTLAMQDEGSWYLISVDSPSKVMMLRQVYPDFAGVEFPSGSSSAVD